MVQRKLRAALTKIADARSLAEAQFALGAKDSVLASLLAAAMREARLSAGISSDAGIKERAASSFAEIVRAEARRIRLGMGLLATIGATSPFVGLFGTVWGIMNSFIGISKSQTTNLAVVAPGIAEALLATAIGLVAAIPAVIIYNHFARVTKGYLELVSRASGAAGRLLSRDLDRTHVSSGRIPARRRSRRWALRSQKSDSTTTGFRGIARDQRHAVHRRHSGSADHLHGGGAAVDRRSSGRSADLDRDAAEEAGQADLCQHQGRSRRRDRRKPGQAGRSGALARRDARCQQGQSIFLRADRAVPYGELMDVLEILRAGGYTKIKLVALEGVPDAERVAGRRQALRQNR